MHKATQKHGLTLTALLVACGYLCIRQPKIELKQVIIQRFNALLSLVMDNSNVHAPSLQVGHTTRRHTARQHCCPSCCSSQLTFQGNE